MPRKRKKIARVKRSIARPKTRTRTKKVSRARPRVKTPRITSTDSRIFASLHRAKRPIAVQRLAKRADLSWKTANEHVKKLQKMGILRTRKTIRKTNVFLDPKFVTLLKKRGKRR